MQELSEISAYSIEITEVRCGSIRKLPDTVLDKGLYSIVVILYSYMLLKYFRCIK